MSIDNIFGDEPEKYELVRPARKFEDFHFTVIDKDNDPVLRFTGTMVPIESSNIKEIGWGYWAYQNKFILRVVFQNGRVYDYFSVPKELFEDLITSESKGAFLRKYIGGNPSIITEEITEYIQAKKNDKGRN